MTKLTAKSLENIDALCDLLSGKWDDATDDEYLGGDDYEESFVCVQCGVLVPFYQCVFTEAGATCLECAEAHPPEDEEE